MKVSEIIESQVRQKMSESNTSLRHAVEEMKPVWDEINSTLKSRQTERSIDVEFSATFDCSFTDGEFIWAHVDGSVTPSGTKWITNFLLAPEILEIAKTLRKGDRFMATSNNFRITKIERIP